MIAEHPGNDYSISGTWELQRNTRKPHLFIDFAGLDDMDCLPMAQSYSCRLRESNGISLYFRKQRSRHIWVEELQAFIDGIESIDASTQTD